MMANIGRTGTDSGSAKGGRGRHNRRPNPVVGEKRNAGPGGLYIKALQDLYMYAAVNASGRCPLILISI